MTTHPVNNAEPSAMPFGADSIKGFIKSNFSNDLECVFNEEKARGYANGLNDAQLALEEERKDIARKSADLTEAIATFEQRKNRAAELEAKLEQRTSTLLTYISKIESELKKIRQDNKADLALVVADVFKSVYSDENKRQLLVEAVLQQIGQLQAPTVTVEISAGTAELLKDALLQAGNKGKVKVDNTLELMEARIVTDSVSVRVSPDKARQIFKNNLMDVVNGI